MRIEEIGLIVSPRDANHRVEGERKNLCCRRLSPRTMLCFCCVTRKAIMTREREWSIPIGWQGARARAVGCGPLHAREQARIKTTWPPVALRRRPRTVDSAPLGKQALWECKPD